MTLLLPGPRRSPPPTRSLPTRSHARGLVEPQIRVAPPYSESVGIEAIQHYESLHEAITPDWWQREFVMDALGVRDDGSWAAFEAGLGVQRQHGKGVPTDIIELAGLFLFHEPLIVHSAHQLKTALEAFRRIEQVITANDSLTRQLRRIMRSKGEGGFELMSGERLMFFSRSGGSGRGFSGQRNVADEAQELDGEEMASILPTMSAQVDAQIIYTFTPPRLPGSHVAALRRQALANADDRTVYWGWENRRPASREALLRMLEDPAAFGRAGPAYPHRITGERLADLRRAFKNDDLFARECLGIWPVDEADGWLVIASQLWKDAYDAVSAPRDPVPIGVDVLADRSWSAIGAAGPRGDGRWHVELTGRAGVWDYQPGVGWVVPRLVEIDEANHPCVYVINDRLVADAADAAGLHVYRPKVQDVAAWCAGLYDALVGDKLRHRGQTELDEAARVAVKRSAGGGWAWAQNPALTAVSLAHGALHTPKIHRVSRGPMAAVIGDAAPASRKRQGCANGCCWTERCRNETREGATA